MYVEQTQGFGLGNFINCTPTIRHLYDKHGKINVLFRQDYVKECYKESPFINIIDKPIGDRLFGSDLINRGNHLPDSMYISEVILGEQTHYDTFIDKVEPPVTSEPYGVFINGSGSEYKEYLDRKIIPLEVQQVIGYHSKIKVIGLGSLNDKNRNIFNGYYGNIRECLSYINGAEWVITNATGFYHVAGAYNKNQLCLWKECLRPRNENINNNSINANKQEWSKKIIDFLR